MNISKTLYPENGFLVPSAYRLTATGCGEKRRACLVFAALILGCGEYTQSDLARDRVEESRLLAMAPSTPSQKHEQIASQNPGMALETRNITMCFKYEVDFDDGHVGDWRTTAREKRTDNGIVVH